MATLPISPTANHPSTIAAVPTCPETAPYVSVSAIDAVELLFICCQSTETKTNPNERLIIPKATCETGREGNGFTSTSDPPSFISECHPGNVDRSRKHPKARTIAIYLCRIVELLVTLLCTAVSQRAVDSHSSPSNTIFVLNSSAIKIKFSGSGVVSVVMLPVMLLDFSALTMLASIFALLEQTRPSSPCDMQSPMYPARTSNVDPEVVCEIL